MSTRGGASKEENALEMLAVMLLLTREVEVEFATDRRDRSRVRGGTQNRGLFVFSNADSPVRREHARTNLND